jgi:hypothetical protein
MHLVGDPPRSSASPWSRHAGMITFGPRSPIAVMSIASSRRRFKRLQPETGVVPVVVKMKGLGFAFTTRAGVAGTYNRSELLPERRARGQLARQRGEWHNVRPAIFRSAAWKVPHAVIVQFVACHASHFAPSLTGQQQQFEQRSERTRATGCQWRVDCVTRRPEPSDLIVAEDAIARLRSLRPVHTRTGIALDAAFTCSFGCYRSPV